MLEQGDDISEILALRTHSPSLSGEERTFAHEVVPAELLDEGLGTSVGQPD
jgi:hypothetical protein